MAARIATGPDGAATAATSKDDTDVFDSDEILDTDEESGSSDLPLNSGFSQ